MEHLNHPEPGVHVERRSFLSVAAAAIGAAAFGRVPAFASLPTSDARLDFAEFLKVSVPIARELMGDKSRMGEDRYLHTLASFAVRLGEVSVPKMRQTTEGDGPHHFIGANDAGDDCPFVVLHWRLEPGARIGLHPHTYGNVVTLGLEGEAVIQNFETVEAADFGRVESFAVRKVHEQILRPGDINLVPLTHGYVHGFVAGKSGARGLDITTRLYDRQPNISLEVAPEPIGSSAGLFEGRWRFEG